MTAQPSEPAADAVATPSRGDQGVEAGHRPVGVILSWALFDYARTIFSYSILAVNVSLWVTQDHGAPVAVYTLAGSASLIIIALAAPALGVLSDRSGNRLPFLAVVTLLMIGGAALLGLTNNLLVGLLFFVVANVGYQSTQVFYDALLGSVSTPRNQGRVSGLGMAFGYLGTISWGLFTIVYLARYISPRNHSAAFLPTALAVVIFTLPCFLFVRERPPARETASSQGFTSVSMGQTLRSVRRVWTEHRALARFLLARLLYADAANTVVSFMAVYSVVVIKLTDKEVNIFLPLSATFAVVGALGFGRLADRWGPKRVLNVVLALWCMAMTWAALAPAGTILVGGILVSGKLLFYAVGPLAGLALGGTRACDRAFLLRVTPPAMIGEAFGLFSLVGDVASITGPVILGAVTFLFLRLGQEVLGYRVAILAIVGLLCVGWALLQRASDAVAPPTEPR